MNHQDCCDKCIVIKGHFDDYAYCGNKSCLCHSKSIGEAQEHKAQFMAGVFLDESPEEEKQNAAPIDHVFLNGYELQIEYAPVTEIEKAREEEEKRFAGIILDNYRAGYSSGRTAAFEQVKKIAEGKKRYGKLAPWSFVRGWLPMFADHYVRVSDLLGEINRLSK